MIQLAIAVILPTQPHPCAERVQKIFPQDFG